MKTLSIVLEGASSEVKTLVMDRESRFHLTVDDFLNFASRSPQMPAFLKNLSRLRLDLKLWGRDVIPGKNTIAKCLASARNLECLFLETSHFSWFGKISNARSLFQCLLGDTKLPRLQTLVLVSGEIVGDEL